MTFKNQSANTQSRERRKVTQSRVNSGGIDETAFKSDIEIERHQILLNLKKIEKKLSQLRGQIATARRRYNHGEHGRVAHDTIQKWEAERADLAQEAADHTRILTEMKWERSLQSEARAVEFGSVFKELASEMLAQPVYDRIIQATIHRLGEDKP